MPKNDTTRGGRGRKGRAADNSNEALSRHLAEVMRILRARPDLPSSLYNGLADGINDFQNDLPSGGEYQESEPHLKLMLDYYDAKTKGDRR
jgi:hypothetical protein